MKSYRWFTFRYVLGFDADEAEKYIAMLQSTERIYFDSLPRIFLSQLGVPVVSESIYTQEELDEWCRKKTKEMLPKIKGSNLYKTKRICDDIRRFAKTI